MVKTAQPRSRTGRSKAGASARRSDSRQDTVQRTIREVVEMEQREQVRVTWSNQLADRITAFAGHMNFVWVHITWFSFWIMVNVGLFGLYAFDAYPFGLLTMIVSLEAIFLSTFVLITQNRQSQKADRRAQVDLEVNIISEREITKLIEMVDQIHGALGVSKKNDREIKDMEKPTFVRELAESIEEAEGKEPAKPVLKAKATKN